MSVIVYDAKKQLMTADTRAYSGSGHPIGHKLKIHRIAEGPFEGSLLGITSNQPGMAEEFKQWVTEGMSKEAFAPTTPLLDAILVKPNGEIFLFVDAYYPSGPLAGDFFTIGSGRKYALGALQAGADALRAVEIACELDSMCGGPVAALNLHQPFEAPADPEQLPLDLSKFSTGVRLPNTPVAE